MIAILLAAQSTVAVLEFRNKTPEVDAAYVSDQVRSAVKKALPDAKVITRENMLVLLEASGKKLEECEGECEVDTGRRIGADLVVSGELLKFGTQYKLNMKLHDARSGELLSGAVASGATVDELDKALPAAVHELLEPLSQKPASSRLGFSAHAIAGYGWISGDAGFVTLPLLGTGSTGSSSAVSFGGGADAGYRITPAFALGVFAEDTAVAADTFVNMLTFGAHARFAASEALSVGVGAGFSRMASAISGPAGLIEVDYKFAGPFAAHAQALYAHSSNSDGLFAGQNTALALGAGVSVVY